MFRIYKMCRLVCILNQNKNNPTRYLQSFFRQSFEKKQTPYIENGIDADYHRDGIGFAYFLNQEWYVDRSVTMNPELCLHPCFQDASLIIGHLRNKGNCEGEPSIENTHPFQYGTSVFCHNGYIKHFCQHVEKLYQYILPEYLPFIKGQTDSEVLFFLLLSFGNPDKKSFQILDDLFHKLNIQYVGNFILAVSDQIHVTRLSNQGSYCSLYINHDKTIISSEPLTLEYELVPENSICILKNGEFICEKL